MSGADISYPADTADPLAGRCALTWSCTVITVRYALPS